VTEIQVSTTQDESTRALEAAQIGLERYIGTQIPAENQSVTNLNASFNVPPPTQIGLNSSFAVPYALVEGDVATIDLPDNTHNWSWIKVCWGSDDVNGNNPAFIPKIEVEMYYEDATHKVYVRKNGYDSAGSYSGFISSGVGTNDTCGTATTYNYSKQINLQNDTNGNMNLHLVPNKAIFMRVRMLGNGSVTQKVAAQLAAGTTFPPQGGIVESVGVAGNTSQKVRATVSYWDLPAVFDSAIFSGSSLTK
jgi:hypothetical protein